MSLIFSILTNAEDLDRFSNSDYIDVIIFCSQQYPLSRQQVTSVDLEELDPVTLKMLAAFR